jgi:hypothetical protein
MNEPRDERTLHGDIAQGEREPASVPVQSWPSRCPICGHDFGRDGVVFDIVTHMGTRHAGEMRAWLATLRAHPQATDTEGETR